MKESPCDASPCSPSLSRCSPERCRARPPGATSRGRPARSRRLYSQAGGFVELNQEQGSVVQHQGHPGRRHPEHDEAAAARPRSPGACRRSSWPPPGPGPVQGQALDMAPGDERPRVRAIQWCVPADSPYRSIREIFDRGRHHDRTTPPGGSDEWVMRKFFEFYKRRRTTTCAAAVARSSSSPTRPGQQSATAT